MGSALALTALSGRAGVAASGYPVLEAYERDTAGKIFVHAENTVTGATIAWRSDERVVMCSTFKASLAACVLWRVDQGQEKLDRVVPFGPADLMEYAPVAKAALARGGLPVAELCQGAVELSDNTCANLLLASIGGPEALTSFWRRTGDPVSRLDHNEPLLNRSPPGDPHDTTSPRAMTGNLRRFVLGQALSDASRERLKGWLVDCKTGANRLRAGLPSAWVVADKTGNNGRDAAGDIAIAWPAAERPVLICAYTQGGTPSAEQLQAVFSAVGRMVGQRLG